MIHSPRFSLFTVARFAGGRVIGGAPRTPAPIRGSYPRTRDPAHRDFLREVALLPPGNPNRRANVARHGKDTGTFPNPVTGTSVEERSAAQAQYGHVVSTRNVEVNAAWVRYSIHWLINAGLLTVFVAERGRQQLVAWIFPLIGILFATVWFLVTRRGHHWVNTWNRELADLERRAGFENVFGRAIQQVEETQLTVNRLAQVVPWTFIVWWIAVWTFMLTRYFGKQ